MNVNPRGNNLYGAAGGNYDLPPPIPPRPSRLSQQDIGLPAYQQHLDGYQPMNQTPFHHNSNVQTSQSFDMHNAGQQFRRNTNRTSAVKYPTGASRSQAGSHNAHLISLSPTGETAGSSWLTSNKSSMNDLEGLDFSASSLAGSEKTDTVSNENESDNRAKLYPDISQAFNELKTGLQKVPAAQPLNQFPDWGTRYPAPVASKRNSIPSPYGWDSSLTQFAAGSVNVGSISTPTTPLQGQNSLSNHGYSLEMAFGSQNPNVMPSLPQTNDAFTNSKTMSADKTDGVTPSCDSFNFVPNLDFEELPDLRVFSVEDNEDPFVRSHQRKSSDLIQLGFEGILTSDEKEYFSLEYFDPLHRKGRTASISSPSHVTTNYFFAKPPEDADVVNKDRNAWVTFDDDNGAFGREDGTADLVTPPSVTQASVFVPEDKVDLVPAEDDAKGHEKLRKKLFVDDESDAFCQMVADLKNKYKSTDEKTNLGFIVSPMCDKQQESMSVKIVVHSSFSTEPFSFTSDVHSLVEHVINHVLYSCLTSSLPSHMFEALKSVDFIFKIYDRSEYLLNEFALSKYSYTHDCLKMDRDLRFCIMRRQDVALPFLRTIDDDSQKLYFPQDHVRDTDVTRDSLEILMATFYKEVEKITDLVLKDEVEKVQFQSLSQSVKAICNILSKIETIDIAKCLSRVESMITQMKSSMPARSHTLEHTGGGYATLQRTSVKVSLIPKLEETLEALVSAVKLLVKIYCQAFHTDFHLDTRMDQPWDPKDVTGYNENFIVQICTVHRIPVQWNGRYDEFKVECVLYHGKKKLSPIVTSTCASVCTEGLMNRIIWDEWLPFDEISLCLLPRETRLCITLVGLKNLQTGNASTPESQKEVTCLGGVTIQLFNRRGYMQQGSQLVPFQMNAAADPVTPYCSTLQPDSALLQFNLPDFSKQIMFSDPLKMPESKQRLMNDLAPDLREQIQDVMKMDCVTSCSADQLEILWQYRHYLHEHPRLLPWILQAAESWDWARLPEIYAVLNVWSTLQPMQALELLLPQYPDFKVRTFAVDCLRKMPTDDLIDFIPQLIQALKYESYHSSPLAKLLLEQSCKSVRFAHQFFWLLKGATQDSLYKRRYELMFVALVSVAGEALYQEFMKQEEIVKLLTQTAEKVQQFRGSEKATLKQNLDNIHDKFEEKQHVLLPHNPGYEVSGIVRNSCSFFTSNAFPLKLVFKNATVNAESVYAMFKVGDDLRQDMMTMQIVRIMDRLWLKEGLDLKMITFSCLPTGPKRGFIEIITESETLRKIQVSSGVTGSFKDRPIKDWLQKHNPTELDYQKAVENFTRSCAGYCVATYVLGVCDRHNDNIMMKQSGHLFHIDFNKILGDSQMFGNIKRDRVKFVLTSDMAYVINDGDRQSDKFQHFIDMCCQSFNILRKHANLFINLFSLMLRSGIPGITEKGVEFVQKGLLPGYTDTQAAAEFTRMIQESLSAKSTQINFFIHNLAQMKFSSHSEGALLTFVPKVFTQQTDGKIKNVEIHGIQKRYTPEKHYIYTLKVKRENQTVPTYIFRIFSEFVEFRNKMAAVFNLINWPPLQGRTGASTFERVILGRSHTKAVAENRRAEIERFLQELFTSSAEVSHCDLVYTFFHPLLRDEQEDQKERLDLPKLKERRRSSHSGKSSPKASPTTPENPILVQTKDGQVKLSLEYVKDTLHVMVMHAKDLPMSGSELPSPYVKTYLLPDPDKHTKRKTKIIKDSTHPTYNELIEYKISRDSLRQKMLQVTIWDHDVLKENNLLGAVYIRFRDIDLTNSISQWYKLEKIQITDSSNLS